MSIMDKSIASRIALLLGLFCLVLCAFLISLLQLLKMLSEEADETVNVALPNMAIASYISKESEWAKGILHDSILCRDRFVHLGVVQEIEARRFPENVLESLEALAVDPGIKEKIKNNLNELNGILAGTNQAVAQRIDNLRNTERLVKRIRTLNADLPQLERELYASGMKPGDPGFNVWKTAYSDVLTAMLLLSMHHDRPYSLRLKSEIRTDVKRLLRSAEASPFSGRLKKLSSDAATMALAEDGLLALYEEYTALESTLDALKITHQYTSNSLIESANAVSQQSWTSIQASKKTLAERYAVIVATVGVTFFLAVFLALFIYRSIVRNVVDPIKRLNNCMLDRVNRIPTPFPESVRYELAEMTSSVRYFTSGDREARTGTAPLPRKLGKTGCRTHVRTQGAFRKVAHGAGERTVQARLRAARQHRGHARRDQVRHGAFPSFHPFPARARTPAGHLRHAFDLGFIGQETGDPSPPHPERASSASA